MKNNKNKKGMFFTLSAIFILTLLLLFFVYEEKLTKPATTTRIRTMNSFLLSLERDMERALKISGMRAILASQDYIATEGKFLSNATSTFSEALFNGSIEGKYSSLLEATTFSDWQATIQDKATRLNIIAEFSYPQLQVYQEDAWHLTLELTFNLSVNDSTGIASWEKKEKIKTNISIEGFEDPFYIIYTAGKISNIINATPYEGNYVNGGIINLKNHAFNSYYASHQDAPSFLMRLEGKIGSSEYGIESMVNLVKLSEQNLPIYDRSVIDYIYFSATPTTNYNIEGMPSWFKLDSAHLEKYNVTKLAY